MNLKEGIKIIIDKLYKKAIHLYSIEYFFCERGNLLMKKMSFEKAIHEYLEYKKMFVRNNTYESYVQRINGYVIPYFKDTDVYDIKKVDIINWQKELYDNKVSVVYINKIRPVLHNFFSYLCDYHELETNPVSLAPRLKNNAPDEEMTFWEFSEFKKFIKAVDDPEYYRFFTFLYYTGARKGEARAITWRQINFKKRTIIISRSLERRKSRGGELVVNKPKNEQSRTILMNQELYETLYSYYKTRRAHFDFKIDEYVFGIDEPLADTTITSRKNNYCSEANVNQIRIHDFRHSNVSLLISLGADICVVCDRLGHKDRNQTLNRYSHMFPSREKSIVEQIDAQASIFNEYNQNLASIVVEFLEKINNLQDLGKSDIIMIEKLKAIVLKD